MPSNSVSQPNPIFNTDAPKSMFELTSRLTVLAHQLMSGALMHLIGRVTKRVRGRPTKTT